ncbi:MAG: Nif3-like dinuclear metal center hexameric protein [Flavobacteriaceae bacterium]|nr:Nif3-like dinuclear metal center hexameric protein [Flavobacteriaceae bacterium]
MIVSEVAEILESLAPLKTAEDFDNVGLLVGDLNQEVQGILITLDTLEEVVEEAIAKKCNLIISFHPIIFSGLKTLTGKTYVERVVAKAIKNDIAIYALHTALDNSPDGVNAKLCEVLGLIEPRILVPKASGLRKLVTYLPNDKAAELLQALYEAGAGHIGNYSHCSFQLQGTGSFKPLDKAKPTIGTKGKLHTEEETQIQVVFPAHKKGAVIAALNHHHPYEEIAYEIFEMENTNRYLGMGMIGEFKEALSEKEFMDLVKTRLNTGGIRHSAFLGNPVKRVAVLGGSGAFAIASAKAKGADAYITADIKYHQFYEAEGQILLLDVGHYESEQFTKAVIHDHLQKKIANFALLISESITNPVYYY